MMAHNQESRSRTKPQPMGGIIAGVIRSLGLSRNFYGWQMVEDWPEIVGEHYSRNSRAIRFQDGTLFVAVDDAGWRQMMAIDSEKILKIIHACPHGRVIKELRLVWGEKGN